MIENRYFITDLLRLIQFGITLQSLALEPVQRRYIYQSHRLYNRGGGIFPEKNPLRGEWVLDGAVELVVLKETRSGIGITDNLAYNRVRHTTHRRIIITEMLTHMIAGNNLQ
jgi:hypothetical protein